MRWIPKAAVLASLLWHPAAAAISGEASAAPRFSFSAFGTLGLAHSSEDGADYTATPFQPNGAGYSQAWSPDIDSRVGAQATVHFTPQLFATVQVISEQNYDNTYSPHVEWGNIAYQPTPELSVRLGRIVLPTFLLADTRKVGYAYTWVRPPVELYNLSPVFDSDGADVSYKMHVGELVNTLMGSYGKTRFHSPQAGMIDARQLWVIADTVEYDSLTLHIAYESSIYSYQGFDPLFDAFQQFGPQGMGLADKYDLDGKLAQLITAGAMYDRNNWFVTGEWGKRNLHSAIGESTAWYLSGGYRLAKLTPYLTYAATKADTKTSDPGLNLSGLPPGLAATAAGLNAALNAILATNPVQNTISVGARWDVRKDIDLKMQYDHIDLGTGSGGTLVNIQPGFQRGTAVDLVSIVIEFVW